MAELFLTRENKTPLEGNRVSSDNATAVALWCGGVEVTEHDPLDHSQVYAGINVPTEVGMMRAQEGDWVVRRVYGDFVVLKHPHFEALVEPAAQQ